MAISSSNFVDVKSAFLIDRAVARDFSGLVITDKEAKTYTTAAPSIVTDYNAGKVVSVNAKTVEDLFSDETVLDWANNYFSYVSKSGNAPSRLKFKKIQGSETTLKDSLDAAIDGDETFGSFTFLKSTIPTEDELEAVAKYNQGLSTAYRMVADYTSDKDKASANNYYDKYVTESEGVKGGLWNIGGLTLCDECSFLTMARLAATDYTGTNTTSCDMFKSVGGVEATVKDDDTYKTLSDLRLNFVGLVKEHGNQWNWYMRGYNMDGLDTAVYDNEMWFKSEIVKDLLTLDDSVEKIPANERGLSMVSLTVMDAINMALRNGTILPGKPLSAEKQTQVLQMLGGDGEKLDQLLTNGWVLLMELEQDGEDYKINYKVAYLKGDAVRFFGGTHSIA